MMSGLWYRISLTMEQIAAGHVGIVRRLFADAITDAGHPPEACLFATSHDTRAARLSEDAADEDAMDADELFFSPQSIAVVPHLLAQYDAQPSAPPERSRAALLVGDESDWNLLPHSSH